MTDGAGGLPQVVRVRPDVAAVHRSFDYAVPRTWHATPDRYRLRVGGRVRVDLHGRRVGGWITALDPPSLPDLDLRPLKHWSGLGPDAEVMSLCAWAAERWLGPETRFLRTASPPRNVYRLHAEKVERWTGSTESWAAELFDGSGATAVVAPASDRWPIVEAAMALGNPLLLVPSAEAAHRLAGRVRRAGLHVALLPDDWDRAASGAVVIGTRAAAFAPTHRAGAIVVLDEHDDVWREERTPTWHAREVAVERARRAGVPVVLVSPAPTPEAAQAIPVVADDRQRQHAGWPTLDIIDRRDEPPGRLGLFSDHVGRRLDGPGRVACILNRTGRVRLLGCNACGAIAACERCDGAVRQVDGTSLTCSRCGDVRPPVCANCGGTRLKNLVLGIGKAREELAALIGEPVGEHTASGLDGGERRVVIGTEALLRDRPPLARRFRTVIFLDFDQHLVAPRQTADVEAMTLLVLAARQVGARSGGGTVVLQTRQPEHRVVRAAAQGNGLLLTEELLAQASSMKWPPSVAQAEVSGPGAAAYVERVGQPLGLTVLGPRNDAWQLRADSHERLSELLADVDRGEDRLRLAVR